MLSARFQASVHLSAFRSAEISPERGGHGAKPKNQVLTTGLSLTRQRTATK
ncbi:hypothetical protein [Lactiplantibacillus plajomi]|uniref:hypothetical protein n=1 Tax=Lactiplantibacillus plajomi TaxID=1457217 RepID=UPI001476CA05